jgi:hypothetical protein
MARFTIANAREFAAKAREARARNAERRRLASLPTPLIRLSPTEHATQTLLARTQSQLDFIDSMLASKRMTAERLDLLTRSRERTMKIWLHLAGVPSPGHRRPGRDRQQPLNLAALVPLEITEPPNAMVATPSDNGNGTPAIALDSRSEAPSPTVAQAPPADEAPTGKESL